jgi:hypothetical protein
MPADITRTAITDDNGTGTTGTILNNTWKQELYDQIDAVVDVLDADIAAINTTSLNASNLTSGTVPNARFPSTLPAVSGASLTNLNASNLASGTVPDARISGAGAWTAVAHSAGNFTSSSGSWTVASGDQGTFAYTKFGKTMTVSFILTSTSVSGTPVSLQITIPGSFTANRTMRVPVHARDNSASVHEIAAAEVIAGQTKIYIYREQSATGTWSNSTDLTSVWGQITFEVQ